MSIDVALTPVEKSKYPLPSLSVPRCALDHWVLYCMSEMISTSVTRNFHLISAILGHFCLHSYTSALDSSSWHLCFFPIVVLILHPEKMSLEIIFIVTSSFLPVISFHLIYLRIPHGLLDFLFVAHIIFVSYISTYISFDNLYFENNRPVNFPPPSSFLPSSPFFFV